MQNTSDTDLPNKKKDRAIKFLDLIKAREQEFETGWWKRAKESEEIFDMDTKNSYEEESPYNILYSNTEVLLPSLYSATPKPDIRSRFKGGDVKPIPEMCERFLTVASDPGDPGGDCFDNAMLETTLSALTSAMGYTRIRYYKDKAFPLVYEPGHYRTLIWGKATRWAKVPWIAFKHPMHKEAMFKQFKIAPEDALSGFEPSSDSTENDDDASKDQCCVYELWDKATKKVYFLSEEWGERELEESDDPLGLTNFFPTPGILCLTQRPGKLKPITLYTYYRNQAEELNRVTVRLNKVLSAIKVRGAYNGMLGDDLKKILAADGLDNELIPAAEAGLLASQGGFDKQIWLLPIESLIAVAQQLYTAREAVKQVIYELTGISDIIRGSSVASETATAQDLKNKWGTVRLRRMQTMVANYARDLFRLSIDCGSTNVPPEKWKEIIQMPIPTAKEKAVAQQGLQYAQQQAQQVQMLAQITGQPAQPLAPPDPKLIAAAQSPTIEDLLKRIASDQNRTFVINIQTSSTIDLDTAQDKAEVAEFMNAMGQLLPGLQGLAAIGPTGIEAAKSILMAVCQRFKFGIDVADTIGKIEPPPPPAPEQKGPPPPSPEEMEVLKQEAQLKLAKIASDMKILQAKEQLELAKIEAEKQKMSVDIQLADLRLQAQRATIAAKPVPSKKLTNASL